MSRIREAMDVINHYPEFSAAGISFKLIVEECCKRIPVEGIADNRTVSEVMEITCERAVVAMGEERIKGAAIARYIVSTFKGVAERGGTLDGFSRYSLSSEAADIRKLEIATAKARENAAKRPLPDPSLPARAVALMKPRPGEDTWLKSGPVMRVLPPRRRDIEADRCEPLADIMPTETVRENRDATYENEAIRKGRAS